jgi:PAS domain S-box-containing protein
MNPPASKVINGTGASPARTDEFLQERLILRTLIDNLPDYVFVKDAQSRFVLLNTACAQQLGASRPEEVLGKSDADFVSPELAAQYLADEQALMRSGQVLQKEEPVQHKLSGKMGWSFTTKVPLRDDTGKIVGLMGIARDITKRKQTEEALRQSRDELEKRVAERTSEILQERLLLRTLIDNLPDCIYAKDAAGRKTMANPADLKNLRCQTEAEAIGKNDFDLFPKDIAEKFWADDQKVIQGQPVINREEHFFDEASRKRWLLTSKLPLRDQDGKIAGLVGIGRDITERKEAEEALRQAHNELEKRVAERTAELSQERRLLRTLIDNLPDGIYAKDTAGRKIMANPADLKVLGCKTEAEAIGKSDFDFFPKDLAEQFLADDQKVLQGELVINREEFVLDEQGRKSWLLTSKLPLRDQDGKIVGLVGINRNITERKQAEEALRQSHDELEKRVTERTAELSRERLLLRTLIDNLPDCIYAKDTSGRKTMANPADLKNLRCKTEAEAIGKSDFDLFPKDIAEQFWAADQKVLQGEPVINREEHFFDETGRKRWLLTSKLPLRDQDGKIVGLVGIGRDVTERKEAEARLELAHKQLLEVSRQAGMSEVATSVLHNVGNVLNSVNVSSSLISEKIRDSKVPNIAKAVSLMRAHESDLAGFLANDPKGRKLLGYLSDLAAHLAQEQEEVLSEAGSLAKKIMHIKEIVAMQQDYAKSVGILEPLSSVDLLEDAVRMNIGSMDRHHVKVVREYAEVPPILVEKHKVLQILVNVIRNAKCACDDSGREDKQITLRVANGDNTVKISVVDNGVGIPAENMTRIFNLGFTTKKNGHGFGLHSGALAAKELGGKLVAFSEGPDRGAMFTLELPIQKPTTTI